MRYLLSIGRVVMRTEQENVISLLRLRDCRRRYTRNLHRRLQNQAESPGMSVYARGEEYEMIPGERKRLYLQRGNLKREFSQRNMRLEPR